MKSINKFKIGCTKMSDKSFDIGALDLDCTNESISFIPSNISQDGMALMFRDVPELVKVYARQLRDSGWRFFAVDQTRGRCYYRAKIITIPMFAICKDVKYKTWYISHEMSHAFDTARSNHGDPFMTLLKKICPSDCIHFELGYKPRNAARNGI